MPAPCAACPRWFIKFNSNMKIWELIFKCMIFSENMETHPVRKRTPSLSTFSEIDTSDLAGDLSEIPNFDNLKDMMDDEFLTPKTDFVNSNNNCTNSGKTNTTTFMKSFQKFLRIPKDQRNNNLPPSSCPSATASDNAASPKAQSQGSKPYWRQRLHQLKAAP